MSGHNARSFSFSREELKIGNRMYYLSLTMLDKMKLEQELNISAASLVGLSFENLQGVSSLNLATLFKYLIATEKYKPNLEQAATVLDHGLRQYGLATIIEVISVAILKSFYTDAEVEEEREQFRIRMEALNDANNEMKQIHQKAKTDLAKKKEQCKKSGQKQY